jgi:hypothetical protein
MEKFFINLKTEWVPALGYQSFTETQQSISEYIGWLLQSNKTAPVLLWFKLQCAESGTGLATKRWSILLDH